MVLVKVFSSCTGQCVVMAKGKETSVLAILGWTGQDAVVAKVV